MSNIYNILSTPLPNQPPEQITEQPSIEQSKQPSIEPSKQPSIEPSNQPSIEPTSQPSDIKSIYGVFHIFISILAIYLAIRCNKNINYTSLFMALFFPYIYVIYSVIMYNGLCKA
jgi:hypothetical protein